MSLIGKTIIVTSQRDKSDSNYHSKPVIIIDKIRCYNEEEETYYAGERAGSRERECYVPCDKYLVKSEDGNLFIVDPVTIVKIIE